MFRHLRDWTENRRRIGEEFAFHLDRLTDEYLSSGLPLAEARRAAKRRMGRMFRHRREARYELRARWRDLISAELFDGIGPWQGAMLVIVSTSLLGTLLADRFSRIAAGFIWLPILAAGLVCAAVASVTRKQHARYAWFGFACLVAVATTSFATWSSTVALWRWIPWPRIGVRVLALSIVIIANTSFIRWLVARARRDWKSRCRLCCSTLRLPSGMRFYSNVLVQIDTTAVVCPFGHGTCVQTHWGESWIPNKDFWNALYSAASR